MFDLMRFPFPVYAADALPAGAAAPAAAAPASPAVDPAAAPAAAVAPVAGAKPDEGKTPNLIATAKVEEPGKPGEKPAEAKPGDKPADKPADAKAVEYTDFKVPEGIELGKEAVGEFKAVAAELGLNQDGAQKLVDLYTKSAMEAANAPYKLWEETQATWQKEVKADPEIGGSNMPTTFSNIAKLIDRFGGKEAAAIRGAFEFTGSGNNPEVIRFLARVGKVFAENPNVTGRAPTTQQGRAERMFPSLAAKAAG